MDILFLFTGLGLGFLVGWLFMKGKTGSAVNTSETEELKQKMNALEGLKIKAETELRIITGERNKNLSTIETLNEEIIRLTGDNADVNAKFLALQEQLATQKTELSELQSKFTDQFKTIANDILKDNSKEFTEQNRVNIDNILKPLREKIKDFEDKVENTYKAESQERMTLKGEIRTLVELNKQISEEANNLASALKGDSKKQGNWGESRLELILEKAGLSAGIHYRKQEVLKDEEGKNKQPDFIINLPDNKQMVIDSKVSLLAYENFCSAETDEERAVHLKSHIESIKNHIKDLSGKSYQNLYGINSPDYVLMYVPIESAFSLALQGEAQLILWALEDKNVVLVTTSTLLATLSTVSFIWKQDNQQKNVQEIARQSGALYDKFVGFVEDLISLGKKIDDAQSNYKEAMKKLYEGNGNLVRRVENIKTLGAKTSKSLPQALINKADEPPILHLPELKQSI